MAHLITGNYLNVPFSGSSSCSGGTPHPACPAPGGPDAENAIYIDSTYAATDTDIEGNWINGGGDNSLNGCVRMFASAAAPVTATFTNNIFTRDTFTGTVVEFPGDADEYSTSGAGNTWESFPDSAQAGAPISDGAFAPPVSGNPFVFPTDDRVGPNNVVHNAEHPADADAYPAADLGMTTVILTPTGPVADGSGAPLGAYTYEGTGAPGSDTNPHIFKNYLCGAIRLFSHNVTIRNCRIRGPEAQWTGVAVVNHQPGVWLNFKIQDCEVTGGSESMAVNMVYALRNKFHRAGDDCWGDSGAQRNSRYESNFVTNLGRRTGPPVPHADSYQTSGPAWNLEFVGNRYETPTGGSASHPGDGSSGDANIYLDCIRGNIFNVLFAYNWVMWGNVAFRFQKTSGDPAFFNANISVHDNFMVPTGTTWLQSVTNIQNPAVGETEDVYVPGFPDPPPSDRGLHLYGQRWWAPGEPHHLALVPVGGNPYNTTCTTCVVNPHGPAPPAIPPGPNQPSGGCP